MIKKGIVFFVIGLIITLSFAQAGRKGVHIKKMKNNAGERWAICIGINDCEDNSIIDLKKARNDAKELGKVLKEYGQFDRVYVMTDDLNLRGEDYPKLMNIKRKMDFLKGFIDPEDLMLFSFSGHGIADSKGEGFLVMADSYREDFQGSSLKVKEIIAWLKEVKVKKSLLMLDACREKFQEGKAINLNGLKAERFLQAEVGAVFYSTKSGWFSYEDKEGNFGVFTRYVIDGLKSGADSTQIAGNGDGIVMVYIPAGESTMGSNDGDDDEKPPHKVYLAGYWIGKTEVTVKQYMKFVNDKKFYYPEWLEKGAAYNAETGTDYYRSLGPALRGDNYPIVGIYWHDAKAYCDWLSKKTGLKFKLPTEGQWEKAARGNDGRKYPWGDREPVENSANFSNKPCPVGSFPLGISPYGLLDMAGNVGEWCSDRYSKDYYKNTPRENPEGPQNGTSRVRRGDSGSSWFFRCSNRRSLKPSSRHNDLGFRLCQDN